MRAKHALALSRAALALAVTVGCAQLEKEKLPQVTTAGPHAVGVGKTIQVTATTASGSDPSYAWESAAPAVATVDPMTGVVTGVAVGEALIRARGASTGAVGEHPVVVVEAPADLGNLVPYYDKWTGSAHADRSAVPFNDWNKDGMIPADCARCHSSPGFIDYLGGDGSTVGKVDKPAPTGTVVTCQTCHNPAADALSSVTFPSGTTITGLGGAARCMTCHQGRASGKDVEAAITKAGVTDPDAVSPMLKFTNVHYFPAAATLYASRAGGGYQYAGQVYDARFRHVPGYDTCTGCHDPHSLKVKFNECTTCHPAAKDLDGAHTIRMMSSVTRDYDGDGDLSEGIFGELAGLRSKLLSAIVTYGHERQSAVCYDAATYPYWFIDGDGDGSCSPAETRADNAFASWTARLTRAA